MSAATMIGASMVEAMDPTASNSVKRGSDNSRQVPPWVPPQSLGMIDGDDGSNDVQRLPLPPHPPSFIETVLVVEDFSTKDVNHAFLSGPPQSGMSSLLLELACSLASKTPCRCPPNRSGRSAAGPSSPASSTSSRALPCNGCTAVLIFRPARNLNECDPFPIPCHSLDRARQPRDEGTSDCAMDDGPFTPSPALLRRIQIHHVGSARDMFRTLLQVQGWEKSRRPVGGILVDDFHQIVSEFHPEAARGSVGPAASTPNLLLGAKLLAILVDTVQVLQRDTLSHRGAGGDSYADATSRTTPAYLVVATHAPSSSRQEVPGGVSRATPTTMGPSGWNLWTHFWRPAILELHPVSSPTSHMADRLEHWISNQHPDRNSPLGTTPASHYEAKLRCSVIVDFGASSHASTSSHSFSIVRQRTKEGDGCILWLANSG